LPRGGSPIILGKDAQTIGGYPRLGYVIAAELDRLAHLIPGARVRFSAITCQEAQALAVERIRWLKHWETRFVLNAGLWPTKWL
jgi:allophanate hydrolase